MGEAAIIAKISSPVGTEVYLAVRLGHGRFREAITVSESQVKKFEQDKRAHFRVRYPTSGRIGFLPDIMVNGEGVVPVNISEGGAAIEISDDDGFTTYRETVKMGIQFPHESFIHDIKAQVVGFAHCRRNLSFIEISADCKIMLNIAMQPGVRGIGTRIVAKSGAEKSMEEIEEWVCPFGSSLKLFNTNFMPGETVLRYRSPEYSLDLKCDEPAERKTRHQGQVLIAPLDLESYDSIYLMLVNITEPSPRVLQIVEYLSVYRKIMLSGQLRGR